MNEKIVTATGSEIICNYLTKNKYNVINDIPYQEGLIECIKKQSVNIVILSSDLSGDYDKYIFIEKIREINNNLKIIMIVGEIDNNYKSFLYSRGIFYILTEGKSLLKELINSIEEIEKNVSEAALRRGKSEDIKMYKSEAKNTLKRIYVPKIQRQQIITFVGIGSVGKSTIASYFSKVLVKRTKAKVLLIDFDIVNAGLNRIVGVAKGPQNPGYILSEDKNSSLNYMVDAIDKKNFSTNIFEKYVVKSGIVPGLDILTGNRSLYVCKNILSSEYYSIILEHAKALYDYIVIDTSGNIFLDSMQFSLLNSTKVFVVTEGNYIALERCCKLLTDFFNVWGVLDNKVNVVINKYNPKSLDKIIIEEIFKKVRVAGYISFSDKYEEMINSNASKLTGNIEEQFYCLLKCLEIEVPREDNFEQSCIKARIKVLKDKIKCSHFNRMEGKC